MAGVETYQAVHEKLVAVIPEQCAVCENARILAGVRAGQVVFGPAQYDPEARNITSCKAELKTLEDCPGTMPAELKTTEEGEEETPVDSTCIAAEILNGDYNHKEAARERAKIDSH